MTVTSGLTVTLTGAAPVAGKPTGAAAAGAATFAGVIADLQAVLVPAPDGTGAVQADTPAGIDISTNVAAADATATPPLAEEALAAVQADGGVDGEGPQRITRRKRAAKDELPEVPIAAPANAAAVQIVMVQPATVTTAGTVGTGGKSGAAAPVAGRNPEIAQADSQERAEQTEQPDKAATMKPFPQVIAAKGTPAKTPPDIVIPAAFAQTDGGASPGDRNAPQDGQTRSGLIATEGRKGADSAPVSPTAVADIVQNLPPIAQSQVGAVVPGDAIAVRAATDVGATLQSQVIDMGVGGQWIDRVAREITALAQGGGHSRFQLSPPNLGRLQIDVWQGDGGGRVQLLTETDEAAQRLRQDQSSLQADVRLSALSLDRIVIDRAPGAFGASHDQGAQSGAGRQHSDTADRSGNQAGSQAGNQAAAQNGGNGGSAAGQGKAPFRRDVFNDRTQADVQDGRLSGRPDDGHVRYA